MELVRLKLTKSINQEINHRKTCSKKLSKYDGAFDYIDKMLIVLSATSGGFGIISSVIIGAAIGVVGASFTLIFSVTTRIIKTLLSITRKKNMIKFLCWLKVNGIALKLQYLKH